MIRVKIFSGTKLEPLEEEINGWLEKERVGPSDIFKVTQSESEKEWTFSIWFIPRRPGDVLTRK